LVFIGQLQSNKIQKLVQHAAEIQTLASEKHARYVDRYAKEFNKLSFPVWIQVNTGAEEQKFGIDLSQVDGLAKFVVEQCPHLCLMGIMAIPSAKFSDQTCQSKPPKLYEDLVAKASRVGKGLVSLGMSSDLEIAIYAGSHCVRIGTAVFGAR
jgi:pyridoxal phosphate enzyme (YggS family)